MNVFATEPLSPDSVLWGLDNVLISPHNADMTVDFRHKSVKFFAENCTKFLRGENDGGVVCHVVDKSLGY